MADKSHLVDYLKTMLNPDDTVRNQAELYLQQAAASNTDAFVALTLEVIGDHSLEAATRNMACILLKKVMTVFEDDTIKGYNRLTPASREAFQRNVLLLLAQEPLANIRDQICDLISDVASSVIDSKELPAEAKWGSLVQHLLELFNTNTESALLSVFRIFDGLFANVATIFTPLSGTLFKVFEIGFKHQNVKVNIACLESFASLIQTVKAKDLRIYKPLAPALLALTDKCMSLRDEDDLQRVIGSVYDVCESEPAFIKPHFDQLLASMALVRSFQADPDSALKTESVECLIFLVERYPKMVADNPARLHKILELVFHNMMEIEDEVPAEWMSPPDGFNDDFEEDDDQKHIKIGMDFIDRLMASVNQALVLKTINEAIAGLMTVNHWKMHHAAIMAMSQLGEYMTEKIDTDILNILKQVQALASNPNPRIRYACCHLLGQYADDLSPDFQRTHHEIYFATILPLLNDPVPRVVAHALASLTNFLENANSVQVAPNFNFLYERLMFWLANGINYVREACLSTLSALCEGSGDLFFPVYDQAMGAIFGVFATAKTKEHRQLRGNAIECATIIGKICGIERFEKYYPYLINAMIEIQNSGIDVAGFDPQKVYILSGWQRVVIAIEDRFRPFIPQVLPRLLEIARASSTNTTQGARTSDSEETEIAVQTIAIFLDNLGDALVPYLPDIFSLLSMIIEHTPAEETRVEAIKTLPSLIKIYKKSGQDVSAFARHVNTSLWNLMDKELDPSLLSEFAFTIQKALKNMGAVLTDEELTVIYQRCFDHLHKSGIRKNELADNFDNEEENKEEVEKIIENDNEMEDEFTLEVANILGVLFRVYQARALPIFYQVHDQFIVPAMADTRLKSKHFGMFLIDDAVEHLGNHIPKETLKKFLEYLCAHAMHESLELRQAAVFGIGITSLALGEDFKPALPTVLQLLCRAIELPKAEDDYQKFFMTVKENAVASLGKIIQFFGPSLPHENLQQLAMYWLKNLPIQHDQKEATQQHKFLTYLITRQPPVFNLSDADTLRAIISVFSRIAQKKKLADEETNLAVNSILAGFKASPEIVKVLQSIPFEEAEKEFLQRHWAN
jgi:hypothetical protein